MSVLVARGVDGGDAFELKVPHQARVEERRDHRAGRAVDMHGDVGAGRGLVAVQGHADVRDGLVGTVVRGTEDRHDADGVVVAVRGERVRREVVAARLHRDVTRLHLEVVGELLPAHLDVRAHHDVRSRGVLALGASALLPAALEGEAAEHRGLARTGRGAAADLLRLRRVPEPGEHPDAALLHRRDLRVLGAVGEVLLGGLRHQLPCLRLHPRRHEGGEVEAGVAVEHQLVAYAAADQVGGGGQLGQFVDRGQQVDGGRLPDAAGNGEGVELGFGHDVGMRGGHECLDAFLVRAASCIQTLDRQEARRMCRLHRSSDRFAD